MGNLERRMEYAKRYNLDAISIKGIWMLFNAEFLKEKRGKISISDLTKSKLDEILGCVSYVFPKNMRIKSVYSTNETVKSTGIRFEPYGKLVSYELYYDNKKIFRVKGKNSLYLGYSMILEALQDRLSMDTQTIERSGEYTIINESFTRDFNVISEYKFLLAPIEHTAYDADNAVIQLLKIKPDHQTQYYSFHWGLQDCNSSLIIKAPHVANYYKPFLFLYPDFLHAQFYF